MRVRGLHSLKRGRMRKVKGDAASGQSPREDPRHCNWLGGQNGPAALWLPLRGKLSVFEGLTSEEPNKFRVGACKTRPA